MLARWLITVAILTAGCALQRGSLAPPADETARASLRAAGSRLYEANCQSCHGRDGQGSWAPQLKGKPLTPGLLADATASRCRSVVGRPLALELTPTQALGIHLFLRQRP